MSPQDAMLGVSRAGKSVTMCISSAVFGDIRQFFIMRQNDRADLVDVSKDIALPEVTQHGL